MNELALSMAVLDSICKVLTVVGIFIIASRIRRKK